MAPKDAVEAAVRALTKARGEIDQKFTETIDCLRSALTAVEHGDRAEASRLLTAAADLEHELLGDCEITGALFDALGLEDGREIRHHGAPLTQAEVDLLPQGTRIVVTWPGERPRRHWVFVDAAGRRHAASRAPMNAGFVTRDLRDATLVTLYGESR